MRIGVILRLVPDLGEDIEFNADGNNDAGVVNFLLSFLASTRLFLHIVCPAKLLCQRIGISAQAVGVNQLCFLFSQDIVQTSGGILALGNFGDRHGCFAVNGAF